MGLALITPPSAEVVSIAEIKSHLRVEVDDDKLDLTRYIRAARQHIENETRRAFTTQTWEVSFDYDWPGYCDDGRYRITLPRPPVQSVTSIKYIDLNGVQQTLASNQYKLAKIDTGEWAIDPAYGVIWPYVRSELSAITVRFVAGYGTKGADVDEPLRQAIVMLAGHWYENRETVIVGVNAMEMPMSVATLIFPYRVFY